MSYSLFNFKEDIKEILSVCQEDLDAISVGQKRQATKWQIQETIIPEMTKLLEMIDNGGIPPKNQRYILSAAYITRGWDWDIWSNDKLNYKLPTLDTNYRYNLDE